MAGRIVSFQIAKPLLVLLCLVGQAYAQQPSEPWVFQEVIKADSVSRELMHQNALQWLQAHHFTVTSDSLLLESQKITAVYVYPVYAEGYISKKLSGRIHGAVQIEMKNGKYRYQFSDFVFHYYKEDRNYQIVSTGKTKPLSETKASGWQKTWDAHRQTVRETTTQWIADLKKIIPQRTVVQAKAAKPAAEKW